MLITRSKCSQINFLWWKTYLKVLYTQNLSLDDSNHDLGNPKYGLWNGGGYGSLSPSLELEDNTHQKVMETLTLKGVFIRLPIRLKWLEPIKAWVT